MKIELRMTYGDITVETVGDAVLLERRNALFPDQPSTVQVFGPEEIDGLIRMLTLVQEADGDYSGVGGMEVYG